MLETLELYALLNIGMMLLRIRREEKYNTYSRQVGDITS